MIFFKNMCIYFTYQFLIPVLVKEGYVNCFTNTKRLRTTDLLCP